jgi:hypothetical protein
LAAPPTSTQSPKGVAVVDPHVTFVEPFGPELSEINVATPSGWGACPGEGDARSLLRGPLSNNAYGRFSGQAGAVEVGSFVSIVLRFRNRPRAIPDAAPSPARARDEGSGTADAAAITHGLVPPITGLWFTQTSLPNVDAEYKLNGVGIRPRS